MALTYPEKEDVQGQGRKGDSIMAVSVQITFIICLTIITLAIIGMGYNDKDDGEKKDDLH